MILDAALAAIVVRGIRVAGRSGWWRTPAWPSGSGPDFVNGAAVLEAELDPETLLAVLHEIEAELGRERPQRWAPRVCDLDLLAAGETLMPDRDTVASWMALPPDEQAARAPERLILPHPRLHERAFVLAPLAELAPDWRHPLTGLTVREMRDALPQSDVAALHRL